MTILDLSVLTGSVVLVRLILSTGCNSTTEYSLGFTINTSDFELVELVLDISTPLLSQAIELAIRKDHGKIIRALLKARPNIVTQRMILVEAVYFGDNTTINYVFEYRVPRGQRLLENLRGLKLALNNYYSSRYINTLRLIIEKFSMYQCATFSILQALCILCN